MPSLPSRTLTTGRLELTNVNLGPGAPKAARIAVAFTPAGLLDGRVERVEIDGPFSSPSIWARSVRSAGCSSFFRRARRPSPGRRPHRVCRIRYRPCCCATPRSSCRTLTTVRMSLSGRIDRRDGETRGTLRGQVRTPPHHRGRQPGRPLAEPDPRLFVDVTGQSDLARLPWPAVLQHRPASGQANFALTGELQLPPPGSALTLDNLIRPASRLALQLSVDDLELPGLAGGVAARADMRLAVLRRRAGAAADRARKLAHRRRETPRG